MTCETSKARRIHGDDTARRGFLKQEWRRLGIFVLGTALLGGLPAAQAQPPSFPACDARAFLFQGNPTNVYAIDLVTGASTQIGAAISPTNINAVGYNPRDNYIYGIGANGAVFRVGSNIAAQSLGIPAGLPAAAYNVGEFDNNGHYWVTTNAASTTVYQIDMMPGSPTYFQVIGTRVRTDPAGYTGGADWAFNPVDGFLYRTPLNANTNRLHLFRYNRASGAQTDLGAISGISASSTILIGANYADAAGFVYGSDNTSGRIFRIDTATNAGTLLSTGPMSGTNDGARCFNAPVPIDFGDAPASYGTLLAADGARHAIPGYNAAAKTAPLMLGSRLSADADGQPSADASADSFDDGIAQGDVTLVTGATTAQVVVRVVNAKATPATLAGWIDFNGNGSFEAAERAQVAVPASLATPTAVTLAWSGLAPIPAGFSAASRFRVATNAAGIAGPTGSAADGEVEDYILPMTQPLIGCSTDPSVFNTGISNSGGVLAPGSIDRNWEAGLGTPTGGPGSVPSWIDAHVVGQAAGAWTPSPFGNANWISYYPSASHTVDVDTYHRYRFTLDPAVVPSAFSLGIDFYADNSVWEVYVNGQPQSGLVAGLPQYPANPYYAAGFVAGNQAHLQLANNWQAGANEIVVQVRSGPAFVGFLGQVTSTTLCPTQVAIEKSADPPDALTPGGTVTYTVIATNSGLVEAPGTVVSDPLPAGIVSGTWTCAASGGAACPNATGTMPLGQTLVTFPGGGVVTYTITGVVDANPPVSITNTASATPPGGGSCYPDETAPPCTATVVNPPVPIVSIGKTTTATQAVPGGTITYQVVARNVGSLPADGTTVADPLPAGVASATWTCAEAGGAACPNASGIGAINETIATFPAGGEVVYTVVATVVGNPPATIANTAVATPPGGGICADGSAAPCQSTVTLPAAPRVRLEKTANPAGALTPGGTVVYTLVASNDGAADAPDTLVSDAFPAGIDAASWTCTAAGGAVCPNPTSGGPVTPPSAMLAETIATFPAGASVTYTITATVSAAPPASIVNTATITTPGGVCAPGNTPLPCPSTVTNPVDAFDFGDAPASYGTALAADGARHGVPGYDAATHTAPLMLGTQIDVESDGVPSPAADGDDLTGIDDEDVTLPSVARTATQYSVTVPLRNATGSPAELTGWIDWNRNGTFEAGEGVTVPVPDGATSATLAWNGLDLSAAPAGSRYARLRLAPAGEIGVANPAGAATAGEVEDHILSVTDTPPDYFLTCPVTVPPPTGAFSMRELWRSPDTQVPVYQTPVVGDLFGDGHPVVVIGSNDNLASSTLNGRVAQNIRIYRGLDGTLLNTITTPQYFWSGNAALALADVDGDGQGEIILKVAPNSSVPLAERGRLIAYRNDGTQLWVSDQRYDYDAVRGGLGLNIADFNGDGIPEVYVGTQIFNARTGARLASVTAASSSGCPDSTCLWGNTVAADMDGDGQLELVAGNTIYKIDITNPNGAAGNSMTVLRQAAAATGVGDGWTAVADIDLDGRPDVIVVRSTSGAQAGPAFVYVWDAQTGAIKGSQTGIGNGGSQPFIGDIDGDGAPEIVFTTADRMHAFDYVAGTGLALKWTLNTTDGSALTTLAMFDFNSDGVTELVYRDESNIRIINGSGATASDLASFACQSGTGTETPVIADLDGSGEARIVVGCGDSSNNVGDVRAFASNSFPWAQTRPVWNQQAYFVAHVSNDLTIPAPQFPHWTSFNDPGQQCSPGVNRPLNAFQMQVTTLDPSTGCPVVCAPPEIGIVKTLAGESGSVTGQAEPGEQLTYTITLTNTGGLDAVNYSLTDALDPNTTFVSATHGGTHAAGVVTWNGLAVPVSGSLALTVVVTVNDPLPPGVAQIANVAYETGTTPPPCPPAGGQCVVIPTAPSVALVKALTGESGSVTGQAEPGEQLTYTITLTNSGGSDATGYGVTDALDPNTSFVSASNGGSHAAGVVTWTNLTVPAGGSLTLTVVVTVSSPLPAGVTQIVNVAYETGTTPPPCPPEGGQCVVIPAVAVVDISKVLTGESGSAAGQAEPGEQLTYTITLTNTGGSAATGYGVTDALDPNTSFVSASNGGSHAAGVVTWTNLTVPAGGSLTLTVVVTVNSPLSPGVTQIANVAYETGTTPPPCPPAGGQCVVIPAVAVVDISKALTGESGSAAGQAEPGEQLTYTITLTNSGGSDATGYGVTDALDPNTSFVSASNGGSHAAGVVTWTNLTVPAGGSLTLTVVVTVNSPLPAGVTQIANVAYETGTTPPPCPPAGGQCVVIPTVPQLSVAKSAGTPTATGTPGQFTLAYTITVGNAGGSTGQYDLSDAFDFNGATVTAVTTPAHASSTGDLQDGIPGGFGAPAGGTIVTGETLAALGSETWTYTVTYLLDDPATAADCADPAGGLRNRAALGGGASGAPPATTCTGAPNVNLLKTAGAPVPTGTPNQFTLTYTVEVSNTGSLAGLYTLADTLAFAGATVTAIGTPVFASPTGDPQDGTLGAFAAPAGGTIVTDEPIAANGAERWTYTVTYVVTDAGAAQDCADPAGGLRNRADLGGSFSGQSNTCTGAPAVVLGKSASGPTPTGTANEYVIDYLVSVQNNGTLGGVYDLADTFTFPGATISAVSAVTHGGSDPLATPLGTLTVAGGTIVTGETIAAGGEETYAYRVTFTLDSVAGVGTCSASGGLRNQAALGGSAAGQVETCTNVPDLAVSKTATGPVPTGLNGQYEITYTVDVINAGEAAGAYDLADAFAYAGATVDAVSAVVHAGLDPLATTLGTLTATGGTIVTGETIAAGGGESYTYTVTFTLTDPATASDCADPAGGLRNRAALGGSAVGEAATCTGAPDVTLAKALTGESGSQAGIAEPGEQLTYTITLTNAGAADAVGYGVTDPLDANVAFVSSDNGGTQAGGVVTWTNLTVPANGTLALTVVVTVNDPLPAGVTEVANAAYQTGTPPPDCAATPLPPNCTITPTPAVVAIAKALAGESGSLAGVAEAGEQLTYTITLTNTGGSDAVNYAVSDRLDPNTAFVSADNGGVHAAGVVTWTVTVPANGSLTLTVVVAVADPLPAGVTQVANVAYETGTTPPPCPPAGGQCVVIPTEGAVVIAKALAGESGSTAGVAEPGEQLTYTITLTNTGGSDAVNYAVSDRLDPNTAFVSADNGGVHAAGVVTWTVTVPANGSVTLTVVVGVNDPLPAGVTQVANVAYEAGTTPPPCPPAGGQCVVIPTEGAVVIAKALAGESGSTAGVAEPGEQLTYTITLTNTGGSDVVGYAVSDRLDPNTAFISATHGGVHSAGVVTWTVTVPANGSLTLTVVVAVADPLPAGVTQVANVAYQAGTTPPPCPPGGPQCVVIPTEGAVLVAKTVADADGNGLAEPGETLTYAIVLTNTGGSAVTGYGLTDALDPNTTFVSADGGGVHAGGVVTWTNLTIPANGTLNLTVVVAVNDPLPAGVGQIANVAHETGTPPPVCTAVPVPANCATIPTPTRPQVQVTKTASASSVSPTGSVVYTVTVANVGSVDAANVTVSDPMPAGISSYVWTCAATGGAACPNAGGSGALAETIASLPAGSSVVYTIHATIGGNPPASIVNVVTLTPPGDAVCAPGNTPPPCRADVPITVAPPREPTPVPVDSRWMLLLLGLALVAGALWEQRR